MKRLFLTQLYRREFTGYNADIFRQDLLAGLTVAAVALPLALAFGVASGASAAAGLVTAILSGVDHRRSLRCALSDLRADRGHERYFDRDHHALWAEGGLDHRGDGRGADFGGGPAAIGPLIAFIPAPVVTGFTSGIAVIIAVGQIDNFLGVKTPGTESAALKLVGYLQGGFVPNGPP